MNKTKGQEKKDHILNTCRELFYEHGYIATSARMISKEANINLGLLNYYFKGKVDIGEIVYYSVRNSFDFIIKKNEPTLSEIDSFLFSSALELQLCLKNPNFGRFFVEIINEEAVNKRMLDFIISFFEKHAIYEGNKAYPDLPAISISAIKRSLVRHSLSSPKRKEAETYIIYYLEQQLYYLGMDTTKAIHYLDMLKKYHIDIAENFTPIFINIK